MMVVIDLADDCGLITSCEYRIVLRSVRSNYSPVSRWLHGGRVKPASLVDLTRYPTSANTLLATVSPFAEKPAWPTDENSLLSCASYTARYTTDPTDDLRPNVRGTIFDDTLIAVPAGQVADARTATLAGSPDGASVFNAGEGDDAVTGSAGNDTGLGDDVLFGRTGDDTLSGQDGDDSASMPRPPSR